MRVVNGPGTPQFRKALRDALAKGEAGRPVPKAEAFKAVRYGIEEIGDGAADKEGQHDRAQIPERDKEQEGGDAPGAGLDVDG